ncbi:MAG TPA: type II secretion system F family protein [archaeon]|nr:type II secretion system F family protein [archaeon]
MPVYEYKAADDNGKSVKGVLTAETEEDLETALESQNLFLISAKLSNKSEAPSGQGGAGRGRIVRAKVKRADIIAFTVHLSTVVGAGVPILQGLDDMIDETDNPNFKIVIRGIRQQIESGSSISDAFAQHPEVFSELYIAILKSGETTGRLDEVLKEIVGFLEWQDELMGTIKQATTYPIIVLTAVMGLIGIMFTFVLPRFLAIFDSFNIPLPLPTRIVIAISSFFQNFWWLIIAAGVVAFVGLRAANKTPQGRMMLDKAKLGIPIFGELVRKIALSRFSHYLATLFGAGVNIMNALEVVERVVGNAVLSEVVRRARIQVGTGQSIALALRESKEFPTMVVRMVTIGETTGNLEETLQKVSDYYDREVPITIKRLFTTLESVIIIVLGIVVLFVVLSIILPMLSLQQLAH